MNIHYFQRYHSKENVETSNTLLMLSRLYNFSPDKFFMLLNNLFFGESQSPEISFELQHVGKGSVPDAVIKQPSFKIVVETKLNNQFDKEQLVNDEYELEDGEVQEDGEINENNDNENTNTTSKTEDSIIPISSNDKICIDNKGIRHINITFKQLVDEIETNYEDTDISDIVEDFKQYCIYEGLIPNNERWLRAIVAGITFDLNTKYSIYYDNAERGYTEFGYLGLYKEKSVRAIGKLEDVLVVSYQNDEILIESESKKDITDELKNKIETVIKEALLLGHDLKNGKHNFFVVEKFYETDFYKSTKNPIQKSKYFDLTEIFKTENLPNTKEISEFLKNKSWEQVNY